jgi:hypothetical protein
MSPWLLHIIDRGLRRYVARLHSIFNIIVGDFGGILPVSAFFFDLWRFP